MNFNHLRVFYTVAQSQNFSRAAEKLHISQPAVSTQIRKLEETLGVPLVENYGRKIKLTDAGQLLHEYAERIFILSQEAEKAIREIRGLEKGELMIGASTTPGSYILPPYIGEYQKKFPGVQFSLKIRNTQTVVDHLLKGEWDLGVIGETQSHPDLVFVPWKRDRLVLIVYPGHPLHGKKNVPWNEVIRYPFIVREKGSGTRRILEQFLKDTGTDLTISMELDQTEAVKMAVASGIGIAVVSEYTVSGAQQIEGLHMVSIEGDPLGRTINVAYHVGKRHSKAALAFLDLIGIQEMGRPERDGVE